MIGSYKKIRNFFPVPGTPTRVLVIQQNQFHESCLPTAPDTDTDKFIVTNIKTDKHQRRLPQQQTPSVPNKQSVRIIVNRHHQ